MMGTGKLRSDQGGQRYDQGIILKKRIPSAVVEGIEVTEAGEGVRSILVTHMQ